MTVPHLMNCEHSEEGWCLDCVANLGDENWRLQKEIAALQVASKPVPCCGYYAECVKPCAPQGRFLTGEW